jgi:multimeric flavodoxin WrbA
MRKIKYSMLSAIIFFLITSFGYASDSLMLYYTRTGNNRMITNYLHSEVPNTELSEIKTKDNRSGVMGFITCLFDQWFDRDAEINDLTVDLEIFKTIVLCSPIWMQNLSSPIRTFIKKTDLGGKDVHLFITYGGRLKEENKEAIKKWMIDQGVNLKGVYGSAVGNKTEEEIKKQIDDHVKVTKLLDEQKN